MKIQILVWLVACLLIVHNSISQSYVPLLNDSKMIVQPTIAPETYAFPLSDVKLLAGPFNDAMQRDVEYLLQLNPDRLLHRFRLFAGLTPKAPIYTGWESETLSGHTLGHYLSACAMYYAATGDVRFKEKTDYVVDELSLCQSARKTGYVGSIPREDSVWNEVSKGNIRSAGFDLNGLWSPWYTLHKVFSGLLDAYLYANNEKAKEVVIKFADWADHITAGLNDEQLQKMLACEFGGMNEALINVYAITGNKKYLDVADRFYHKAIMDPLAEQKDQLSGKHSNTQIPKIIGAARRYELTSTGRDKTISEFFWNTVVNKHTYVMGGNSEYEYLTEPGKLTNHLSQNTAETCNTYNMMKLTRHLFSWQPKAELFNFYERALYNNILSSQHPQTGMMCYFTPLRMGAKKDFSTPFDSFWCCVGSGIENHVKYGEAVYNRGKDGSLYVNLFIASELNWKEKNAMIKQETTLPYGDAVTLSIQSGKPQKFTMRIRKPEWTATAYFKVNKKIIQPALEANGYWSIARTWKKGDQVEIVLPMQLHTEPMPDNANRIAVLYGPIVLAGDLGNAKPDPVKGIPVFVNEHKNVKEWVQPVNTKDLVFEAKGVSTTGDIRFSPLYLFTDHYYSVYWDQFTTQSWAQQQVAYEAEKERIRNLEERTVDVLRLGEMQPERDHNVTGERTTKGEDNDRTYRDADERGWFSFQMKVSPDTENTLMLTYWGSERGRKMFDIFVDDVKIGTQELNSNDPGKFFDVNYALSPELVKNKSSVTVKLVALPGKRVGALYGARVVRGDVEK
ncbi:MAG TPA: glycoside hydrolase family 127 protein [Cyclobacteriaceae bacterium]|mgnify:CR=1 FL=1|nr:glycoside hydrolase family 127 protein [Cyclobacteriaceae bacterium]